MPYHYSEYVFAIPPGKEVSLIKKLFKPFSIEVWAALAATLVMSALIILFILKKTSKSVQKFIMGSRTTTPFMNLVQLTLTNGTSQMPGRNFARFLLVNFMIFTLIFQNAYTGSLFGIMKSNAREPTPGTFKEIFDAGFVVHLSQKNFDRYDFIPGLAERKMPSGDVKSGLSFHDLIRTDPEFKATCVMNLDRILITNRNLSKHGEPVYNFCPQIIYAYPRTISLQRNSLLTHKFSMIFLRLQQAGILHQWESIYIEEDKKTAQIRREKSPPTALRLCEMQKLAYILIFGWTAAFVTFLRELGVFKKSTDCIS